GIEGHLHAGERGWNGSILVWGVLREGQGPEAHAIKRHDFSGGDWRALTAGGIGYGADGEGDGRQQPNHLVLRVGHKDVSRFVSRDALGLIEFRLEGGAAVTGKESRAIAGDGNDCAAGEDLPDDGAAAIDKVDGAGRIDGDVFGRYAR